MTFYQALQLIIRKRNQNSFYFHPLILLEGFMFSNWLLLIFCVYKSIGLRTRKIELTVDWTEQQFLVTTGWLMFYRLKELFWTHQHSSLKSGENVRNSQFRLKQSRTFMSHQHFIITAISSLFFYERVRTAFQWKQPYFLLLEWQRNQAIHKEKVYISVKLESTALNWQNFSNGPIFWLECHLFVISAQLFSLFTTNCHSRNRSNHTHRPKLAFLLHSKHSFQWQMRCISKMIGKRLEWTKILLEHGKLSLRTHWQRVDHQHQVSDDPMSDQVPHIVMKSFPPNSTVSEMCVA